MFCLQFEYFAGANIKMLFQAELKMQGYDTFSINKPLFTMHFKMFPVHYQSVELFCGKCKGQI